MLSKLVSVMQEVAQDDAYKPELVSQDNTYPLSRYLKGYT